MFDNLSAGQIIIYIIAALGIIICIFKIITIIQDNRHLARIAEIGMFCEMIHFQMRLAVPFQYLINKIYKVEGTINAYNYLAFTNSFMDMLNGLGDDVSEDDKRKMVTIPMLNFCILGEVDNYYKIKIFLTSNVDDEHTYFLYEHYDKKDPKLSIYANNEPAVNITYKQKKQIIKALYLSLIDMYKYPISKDALEKSTIKRTLSKPRLLNLTKMNGSILFRFMPIFTEEEIREMERDQKSEKGFDKI